MKRRKGFWRECGESQTALANLECVMWQTQKIDAGWTRKMYNKMKIFFMLMFVYCNCIVVKTLDDSKGASEYWKAKAEETRVDTTTSIIIFGVIFGLPIF